MTATRIFYCLFILLACTQALWAQDPSSWGQSRGEYVLTNATILAAPGQVLNKADLHIRKGKIVAVGRSLSVPAGTRKVDLSGLVVHAGFIDPYVTGDRFGLDELDKKNNSTSGSHPRAHDDFRVVDALDLDENEFSDFRDLGFTAIAVAPENGIFRGQSAVYRTGESKNDADLLIKADAYSALAFERAGWSKLEGENYPLSMMGCVAFIRQHFLDAEWYRKVRSNPELYEGQVSYDGNSESLAKVFSGERPVLCQSDNYLQVLRWLKLLPEIGLQNSIVVLSGQEWKNYRWFQNHLSKREKLILPLNFPDTPKLGERVAEEQLGLDTLREWYYAPANAGWLQDQGTRFALTTHGLKSVDKFPKRLQEAIKAGLNADTALAALTTQPAQILGLERSHGTLSPGKSASFVIREGLPFSGKTRVREVWIDGERFPNFKSIATGEIPEAKEIKTRDFVSANYSKPQSPFPPVFAPGVTLIKGATLWTQAKGTIQGDLLFKNGLISQVGSSSSAAGAHVVDGTGLHVTPGIVDAHSHTAVDGMVNEPGANITAMVRMKDVIDPFDHDIYLQLASGVTASNILHGSANAIGGQAITCKWRFGEAPQDLIFQGAPEGIKFALGENPKQSNWGDKHRTRYPQSRMGVMELIRGAFITARNYERLLAQGKTPKPDLMLDALVEVLKGERLVHCHSYRQDEILALIRTAEDVGFKVDVFQHVLEGYKVAEALVEHGAAASTFADWWAYKVEVEDAIPHNAALMAEAGVNVSINSDSDDLARRLNTEAAKSIRYGGMSEVQALNLITKNPATQLGVGDKIGTLEVGKQADIVVWSANPLTQEAIVLETWIDGKRYFSRSAENERAMRVNAERDKLLEILKAKKEGKKS